jgi:hypothetical protein
LRYRTLRKGDYECAITLAGAAEGMLPETDEAHFRQKVIELSNTPEIKAAGGAALTVYERCWPPPTSLSNMEFRNAK